MMTPAAAVRMRLLLGELLLLLVLLRTRAKPS
jgi:hypothetical protein